MNKAIIRSEYTKFISYHWSLIGIVGAIILPSFVLLVVNHNGLAQTPRMEELLSLCLQPLYLGQVGIIIAMAGYAGQEYTTACLRTSLLSTPSRMKLLLSKKTLVIVVAIITYVISLILCFITIVLKYRYSIDFGNIANLIGSTTLPMFSWVIIGLVAFYITVLAKSFIVSVTMLFPLILGLDQMLMAITNYAKYLPNLAGMNFFLPMKQDVFLSVSNGIIVQFLWVLVLGGISMYVFRKRDVR